MLYQLPLSLLAFLPLLSVRAAPYCTLRPSSVSSSSPSTSTSGSSPTSSGPSGSSGSNSPSNDLVAMSWFTGWNAASNPPFTPDNITWSKYSTVAYAFATTTPDVNTVALEASDEVLLPQFVDLAHQNNVKAVLTIGGWTGSQYFSTAVATSENRTAFVNAVLGLASKYNLDGLDFDWEYPAQTGIGCNTNSPDDAANFLSFLQALRAAASNLTLSAAVGDKPWTGSNGSPSTNVSAFAASLDYIEVMNYDVWGSWSPTVGPNSPLNDTCAPSADQQGSAVSALAAWTAAGFPANQIVLGVAGYGHSFDVPQATAFASGSTTELAAYPSFEKSDQPLGDSWDSDAPAGVDQCGAATGGPSGIFNYWGLIEEGFLMDNGTVAPGIGYRYDSCSQTPYVYKPSTQVMVSFDNTESFAAKGSFIKSSGMRGFAMWDSGSDYENMLIDSIRTAAGL
ncbi:uncharacterized protein FIBRA_03231 [Fibroporia radiculosa]|uniref:GH18 domain-containing protein n=1 Tax=Fibroporia radiculosa TaxID=599839 RepID=J4G4N6_9APHY|nr:uncharacterized protein FIBRA_03231 [Fibroporia radiculosa]CCM01183.1 predicted protein [Fibroporia radiculosa]